jgi:diacylglycerol O-acyltransferase
MELGTDIADPVARLAAIRDLMASSDVMARRSARASWRTGAAGALGGDRRHQQDAALASALLGNWTPLANCAIANVPGPRVPLYLQGARLSYLSAIMPIADGMGLVFSVTSYSDMLIVSFTACYEQLPDPEQLAQCLRDSFQEYLALLKPPARRKPKAGRGGRFRAAAGCRDQAGAAQAGRARGALNGRHPAAPRIRVAGRSRRIRPSC